MILQLQHQTKGSLRQICQTLQLPRSSFYRAAHPSAKGHRDEHMGRLIEEIFKRHRRRYGYRRIQRELGDRATICAPCRLRRLMRQRGLRALQPKNYLPKTSDGRADRPSANLLAQEPVPTRPDQAWAGDITFIPARTGWLYLAVVIDLGSRRIVGWSLANHAQRAGGCGTPTSSQARPPGAGRPLSQRPWQPVRRPSRTAAARWPAPKHVRSANPYDNAWTESFIGTLKREMLQGGCFADATDARLELFEYIEAYYNNLRKHSAPRLPQLNQFETLHHSKTQPT